MHVRWTNEAFADLEEIVRYIANASPSAAQSVAQDIVDAAEELSAFPHRGRLGPVPGTREIVLAAIGYIITYEVVGEAAFIQRIQHGAQDRPRR